MSRNLNGINSTDANSINGILVQPLPPPNNNDVITYSSTAGQFIYAPASGGGGGITTITNVGGGAGIFRDITSGPTANLRSILNNTPTNLNITQNANDISLGINSNPTFGNISATNIFGTFLTINGTTELYLPGTVRLDGIVKDSANSAGSAGQVLTSNGTNVTWATNAATNIYNADGTLTAARTVNFDTHNLTFDTPGSVRIFRINAQTHADTILANTYTATLQMVTPRLRSLTNTIDFYLNDIFDCQGFTNTTPAFAKGLQITQGVTTDTKEYLIERDATFPTQSRIIASDAITAGLKQWNFVGKRLGTTYEEILSVRNDTQIAMKHLQTLWPTSSPVSVVTLDSNGVLRATPPTAATLGSNVYNSDGICSVGVGGTRTIGLPATAHLNVLGGYLQNNWSGITTVNPRGSFNDVNCPSAIMADANGNFLAYSNTKTINSMRIPIKVSSMNATDNSINVFETTTAVNFCFNADIYLSINGFFAVNAYQWKVCVPYFANFVSDAWMYWPPVRDNGWVISGGPDYGLEILVPSANPQTLRLRIRMYRDNGINPESDAYMTVIRRESDQNEYQGSYEILDHTPYSDTSAVLYVENQTPMHTFNVIEATGEPTSLVFFSYGQRFIKFHFSTTAWCTSAGTLICELFLNGASTGVQNQSNAFAGESATVQITFGIDAVKWLYPEPGLLLYGVNTMSVVYTITGGGAFDFSGRPYQLWVEQNV